MGNPKINLHSANSQKSKILIGMERPSVLSETLIVATKQDPNRHKKAIRAQQEADSPQKIIRVLLDTGLSGDLPLRASLLLEGLSLSHGVLPTAPLQPKRWATSRYPLWTTLTAKVFIWSLILSSMLAKARHRCTINPKQADLARPGSGVGFQEENNHHRWDPLAHEAYQ